MARLCSFDELSKAVGRGFSRREALALVGGGFAALTFWGPLGVRHAQAGPGCGRACQDAGHQPGSRDFVDCVHRCGEQTTACEVNALQACIAVNPLAVTVTVSCCGATGTCNTLGVCVCPDSTIPCAGLVGDIPSTTCCTGVQVCDTQAGVCLNV